MKDDPFALWQGDLDPVPIVNDPHIRPASALIAVADKLGAVHNLLGMLHDGRPEEREFGLAVTTLAVDFALAVLDHLELECAEGPTPPIMNVEMASLVVGNLLAVVMGHLDAWQQAAHDDFPAAESTIPISSDLPSGNLVIDRNTFTTTYKGKSRELGNTVAFRLLERLAQSPGIYIPINTLIHDVWNGKPVSDEAVQRQASTLGTALKNAGIEGLVIDGSQPGHYRLILR
jgi:hypothetical protein